MGNTILVNLVNRLNLLNRTVNKINSFIFDKVMKDEAKILSLQLMFMDLHSDLEQVENDFISKTLLKIDFKASESAHAMGCQFTLYLN